MHKFMIRLLIFLGLSLIVTGCHISSDLTTEPQPAQHSTNKISVLKQSVTNSSYWFIGEGLIRASRSEKCLTRASTSSGNFHTHKKLKQYTCEKAYLTTYEIYKHGSQSGDVNQKFTIIEDGNYVKIKHSFSGKCLDVTGGNSANGTTIQLYDCQNGNDNQRFTIESINGNEFMIRNKKTNKCVDLANGNTSNDAGFHLWTCSTSNVNQRFVWKGSYIPKSSTQIKIISHDKCLDLSGGNTKNGTNIQQWSCVGNSNQKFRFEADGDYFRIKHSSSGKCVDVKGGNSSNGTNIQLYSCGTNSDNQRFTLEPLPNNRFRIRNKKTNKCLDLHSNKSWNGTNIRLYDCNGGDRQVFGWGDWQMCIKTKDQSNAGTTNTIKLSYALHHSGSGHNAVYKLFDCNVHGVKRGQKACCYPIYRKRVQVRDSCDSAWIYQYTHMGIQNSGSDNVHITKVYTVGRNNNMSEDSFFCEAGMSSCFYGDTSKSAGTTGNWFKVGKKQEPNVRVVKHNSTANVSTYGTSIEACTKHYGP